MSRTTRIVVGVLIVLAVLAILIAITTPSFGSSADITNWRTELHASEPEVVEIQPMLAPDADAGRVTQWRTTLYVTTPQQLRAVSALVVTRHRRATVCTIGGNIVIRTIVKGCLAMGWDYNQGFNIVNGSVDTTVTGDATLGWEYIREDGYIVQGGGTNANGIQYQYRRAHFHFKRGLGDLSQHAYPWAALTVRGNGTCTADRYDEPGTIACN